MARIVRYKLTQHSTFPVLQLVIQNRNGKPLKLFGATVFFRFRRKGASHFVNSERTVCSITDGQSGVCEYEFIKEELNARGTYYGQVEVSFPDGGTSRNKYQLIFEVN